VLGIRVGDKQCFFYMKQRMFVLKTQLMHRKLMRMLNAFINTPPLEAYKVAVSRYRLQKKSRSSVLTWKLLDICIGKHKCLECLAI
jgi:hypothetical protein